MNKAILYKEWIKVRLYTIVAFLVWAGFTAYAILNIQRMITFHGAAAVWLTLLEQNGTMVEVLKYLPPLLALGLSLVQFLPEMQEKRLKLTLHLPMNQSEMLLKMLFCGSVMLVLFFLLQVVALEIYLHQVLARELVCSIMKSASVWYLAGVMLYFLASWVILEPTWKRRLFNLLVTAGILRLLYFWGLPGGYSSMWCYFAVWTVLFMGLPVYSMDRFRRGCQD